MISVHDIVEKKDYRFWEMMAVEAMSLQPSTPAQPDILLSEPGWTLHELDYAENRAVFLDVGPDGDVINVPFTYNAQFRLARRIAFVSFDDFLALSSRIKFAHRIIHFFNIGHCGSTLLHHVFNESGEVWDISEPKFTRDIALNRDVLPLARQLQLAKAGLAFMSLFPRARERETLSIKHFSQCTKIYDIWRQVPASAKCIYLYRDAVSWCNSFYGFWQRIGMAVPMPVDMQQPIWSICSGDEPPSYLDGLIAYGQPELQFSELSACMWGLHTQEFQNARHNGLQCLSLRYNELLTDREAVLKQVFSYCGLDPDTIAAGLKAFAHDAHAGEVTAHDIQVQKLDAGDADRIRSLLGSRRLGLDPHIRL